MHLHKVSGIKVKSQKIGEGDESFLAHFATFYSFYAGASVEVVFYTEMGRRLLVNGGSQWGECPPASQEIGRVDIHVTGVPLKLHYTPSTTGNYVQSMCGKGSSHELSYVTATPVSLTMVDDPTAGKDETK